VALVKELSSYEVSVHCLQADLGSAWDCERLAQEAISWSPSGGIDILASNAGAGKLKNWLEVIRRQMGHANFRLLLKSGMGCLASMFDLPSFSPKVCCSPLV
jgi:NAD(P)-dependent dehydrogenase (short-subunit alcohol dehydrogenase family)